VEQLQAGLELAVVAAPAEQVEPLLPEPVEQRVRPRRGWRLAPRCGVDRVSASSCRRRSATTSPSRQVTSVTSSIRSASTSSRSARSTAAARWIRASDGPRPPPAPRSTAATARWPSPARVSACRQGRAATVGEQDGAATLGPGDRDPVGVGEGDQAPHVLEVTVLVRPDTREPADASGLAAGGVEGPAAHVHPGGRSPAAQDRDPRGEVGVGTRRTQGVTVGEDRGQVGGQPAEAVGPSRPPPGGRAAGGGGTPPAPDRAAVGRPSSSSAPRSRRTCRARSQASASGGSRRARSSTSAPQTATSSAAPGQVVGRDRRRGQRRPARVRRGRPQADGTSGASRPARPARCSALPREASTVTSPVMPGGGVEPRLARPAGVDDRHHPGDGQAGLGHVRGEHHPSATRDAGPSTASCSRGGSPPCRRRTSAGTPPGASGSRPGDGGQLAHPGEEDQHVAVVRERAPRRWRRRSPRADRSAGWPRGGRPPGSCGPRPGRPGRHRAAPRPPPRRGSRR
jgi:hypothetical protein